MIKNQNLIGLVSVFPPTERMIVALFLCDIATEFLDSSINQRDFAEVTKETADKEHINMMVDELRTMINHKATAEIARILISAQPEINTLPNVMLRDLKWLGIAYDKELNYDYENLIHNKRYRDFWPLMDMMHEEFIHSSDRVKVECIKRAFHKMLLDTPKL